VTRDDHVELNSDLLYLNHHCDPTTYLDVTKKALVALRPVKKGEELNFFYPSTEWDMGKMIKVFIGGNRAK
jgi:hypothetical protein